MQHVITQTLNLHLINCDLLNCGLPKYFLQVFASLCQIKVDWCHMNNTLWNKGIKQQDHSYLADLIWNKLHLISLFFNFTFIALFWEHGLVVEHSCFTQWSLKDSEICLNEVQIDWIWIWFDMLIIKVQIMHTEEKSKNVFSNTRILNNIQ